MTNCPFCNFNGTPIRHFETRESERLHLWGCDSCSCEFLYPQPSNKWLEKEYSGYFSLRQGRTPVSKSLLCQLIISKLGDLGCQPNILEIGGGEGFFAREVLANSPKAKITVVEPQADPNSYAHDNVSFHKMLIEDWIALKLPLRYDFIVGMDLIEHLREPMMVIKMLSERHLNPGGKLLLTTPDAGSIFRKFLGKYWPHYKVEHLTYPSTDALETMAKEARLKVVTVTSLNKPLQLGYILAILRNFGPSAIRRLGKLLDSITPNPLRSFHLKLPSGELIFVGERFD